jgi:hypothetical protein
MTLGLALLLLLAVAMFIALYLGVMSIAEFIGCILDASTDDD